MEFIISILFISLAGLATAQKNFDHDGHSNEHNWAECSNGNCILLRNQVPDCCEYRKKYSRYADGRQYKLLNPCEEILLYRYEEKSGKWITYSHYYFSKDLDSPILKLTKENLKGIYFDDFEFHKKLDEIFSNDSQLSRFDGLYNTYVVNWLYARVKQ
jgi:hypothetical protein